VAQPPYGQGNSSAAAEPGPLHHEPEKKFRAARKVQETILGVDLANNILETLAAKLEAGEIKGRSSDWPRQSWMRPLLS